MSRMIDNEEELKDYGLIEINGCNVIECEFYDDLECNAYRQEYWEPQDNTKDLCECHSNCYFKQLQRVKSENEKLKEWLENKEKACNHLRDVNARKKEQIKNLNYMLFEEKEMTTQEWKLKYRLANKERKFIQYKEITNNKLNNYKQVFEDIIKYCNVYSKTEDYVIDQTFNEFLENIFNKINEIQTNFKMKNK